MILGSKLLTFWSNRFFSLISFILLFSISSLTWSLPEPWWPEIVSCVDPYLGVDMGLRRMAWKKDYGSNVFKHSGYQPNIYTGLKLNPYFGVEVGYENLNTKQHSTVLTGTPPQIILSFPFPDDIVSINSNVKLSGWHFNTVGIYPLDCWNCVELLGTIGLAYLKTTQKVIFVGGNAGLNNPAFEATFSKSKLVSRISLGAQYKITDNLKLRIILLGIENTSLFGDLGEAKEIATSPYDLSPFHVKMKHHTYHSLGIIFNF